MSEIIFRKACRSDLSEIISLVSSAILEMEKNGIHQWDELYPIPEDFSEDISKGEQFVGTVEGRIAVIYTLNQSFDDEYKNGSWQYPNEPFGVIHRLCVSPEFQHRGIAAETVSYIENELRRQGIKAIRLDVFTENPYALRLYEKLGFKKTGTVKWRKGDFNLMEKYIG
ncbi:MAG: GNAT family N-acetyltransferase [Huintestinicola sp.]|uniref:GNAT family N-acetyltransferase n=1 Tax=Huintestinicola sp. TaxID=2981661 RepID=UPI003F0F7A4A